MKPHPRIRKMVKWGGTLVSVVLLVVWVGSGWWYVQTVIPGGTLLQLGAGTAIVSRKAGLPRQFTGIHWMANRSHRFEWAARSGRLPDERYLVVPLWPPLITSVCAAGVAWRLDFLTRRRARIGHCVKCNYNRAGLAGGARCPECGAMPVSV